jgi:hypothetical protein
MQEQKGIPAQESLERIEDLLQTIKEGSNVSIQSVSCTSYTQDRQPNITDLLNFKEPTVEN